MGIKHKYRIEKPVDSGVSAHVSSGSEQSRRFLSLSAHLPLRQPGVSFSSAYCQNPRKKLCHYINEVLYISLLE